MEGMPCLGPCMLDHDIVWRCWPTPCQHDYGQGTCMPTDHPVIILAMAEEQMGKAWGLLQLTACACWHSPCNRGAPLVCTVHGSHTRATRATLYIPGYIHQGVGRGMQRARVAVTACLGPCRAPEECATPAALRWSTVAPLLPSSKLCGAVPWTRASCGWCAPGPVRACEQVRVR